MSDCRIEVATIILKSIRKEMDCNLLTTDIPHSTTQKDDTLKPYIGMSFRRVKLECSRRGMKDINTKGMNHQRLCQRLVEDDVRLQTDPIVSHVQQEYKGLPLDIMGEISQWVDDPTFQSLICTCHQLYNKTLYERSLRFMQYRLSNLNSLQTYIEEKIPLTITVKTRGTKRQKPKVISTLTNFSDQLHWNEITLEVMKAYGTLRNSPRRPDHDAIIQREYLKLHPQHCKELALHIVAFEPSRYTMLFPELQAIEEVQWFVLKSYYWDYCLPRIPRDSLSDRVREKIVSLDIQFAYDKGIIRTLTRDIAMQLCRISESYFQRNDIRVWVTDDFIEEYAEEKKQNRITHIKSL